MEISPCKCGGKAHVVQVFPGQRDDCFIRCLKCGKASRTYKGKEAAVEAWNKEMVVDKAFAEALKELADIDTFCHMACTACNHDWYCPTHCDMLEKAKKLDFEKIVKSYARNEGDWSKVFRYIKRAKEA